VKCTTLIVADLADGSSLALCRARSSVRLLTLAAVCGIAAGVVHAGSLWPLGDVTAIVYRYTAAPRVEKEVSKSFVGQGLHIDAKASYSEQMEVPPVLDAECVSAFQGRDFPECAKSAFEKLALSRSPAAKEHVVFLLVMSGVDNVEGKAKDGAGKDTAWATACWFDPTLAPRSDHDRVFCSTSKNSVGGSSGTTTRTTFHTPDGRTTTGTFSGGGYTREEAVDVAVLDAVKGVRRRGEAQMKKTSK